MQFTAKILSQGGTSWEKMKRVLAANAVPRSVRVGILEGSTTPDGESIATYAAGNEYGTEDIPSRPFMRITAKKNKDKWALLVSQSLSGHVITDSTAVSKALQAVGRVAKSDIQATIKSNVPPPNNPEYAEQKRKKHGGYSGTLFNQGYMFQSIDFQVVDGLGKELP